MRVIYCLLLISFCSKVYAQEEIPVAGDEQLLEEHADWLEDSYQKLDHLKVNPYDLNQTDADDLSNFPFLSSIQIDHFLDYRKLLGPFEEILELQAIPGWDIETIKKIMPYVVVRRIGTKWDHVKQGFQKNNQMILYRTNFNDLLNFSKTKYSSTALVRYRFSSKSVQAGLQIEKDKGEKWWTEKKGLAFLSGYFSIKTESIVKEVLLGDYQIGMGQGLIMGMGRGVIKSTAIMLIKRQSATLMPFRSSDENRFMRGVAMVLGNKKVLGFLFASSNKIDGNVISDTLNHRDYVSSLQTSGLHVTEAELQDWHSVTVNSYGFKIEKKSSNGDISMNYVDHHFDKPIGKHSLPYHLYSMQGNHFRNISIDFGKTIYNTHFFGELAIGEKKNKAILLGALIALHRNIDFSFLIRSYDKGYHSYLSKSISENSEPSNEQGIYNGLSLKITPSLFLESYIDIYTFPWLKYRLDRPSNGKDQMIQMTWKPDKKTIFTIRYKDETKYENADMLQPLHWSGAIQKKSIRSQMEHKPNLQWKWRARVEYVHVQQDWSEEEAGMLFFLDLFWSRQNLSINGRLMYCSTDGFNSRIYAYENDVLYYGRISQFQGRLIRSYLNVDFKIHKNINLYTKMSSNLIRTEVIIRF